MKDYQRDFIKFAIESQVLKFGKFKLKSGRESPYFFNAGLFNSGLALAKLGQFYAAAINDVIKSDQENFNVLFGPAYKGIPLVSATSVQLYEKYSVNLPYSFNRKEAKDHGEGGDIVGSPLKGRIMVIDDVITAGTAIRESMGIIQKHGAELAGVLVALDRQEKGTNGSELSAIQEVERDYQIKVRSIVSLGQIVEYLEEVGGFEEHLAEVKEYRRLYGV